MALLLTAVVLAACTGGGHPSADATGSTASAAVPTTSSGSGTSGPASPRPTKPARKPPPPRHHEAFRFHVATMGHTLTTGRLPAAKVQRATRRTARAVRARFDTLFRMTYVDPAHWKEAKYGEAFQTCFAGQARAVARTRLTKLTLGRDAGKRFESIHQPIGRLNVKVLLGAGGGPVTALVHATFNERAVRAGGGTTVVVSDGRYYLTPTKHGWLIDAFRVGRHDHALPSK